MITLCAEERRHLEDLARIPVLRPQNAGARWAGVSHYQLAIALLDQLGTRGIQVTSQQYGIAKEGIRMVAGLDLSFPDHFDMPGFPDQTYSLAIFNDNGMQYALRFACGTTLFVCSNAQVFGEYTIKRRHTNGLILHEMIAEGIDSYIEQARQIADTLDALKAKRLTTRQSDHLIAEAGRANLMPWSLLGQVEERYRDPLHEEFRQKTGYGLLNAFNEVSKKLAIFRQTSSIAAFTRMLLN